MQNKFNLKKMEQAVSQITCQKWLDVVGMALQNKEYRFKDLIKCFSVIRKMEEPKQ